MVALGFASHDIPRTSAPSPRSSNDDPAFQTCGGEGGIRTLGARKGSTVFETARFNHSRTSPQNPRASGRKRLADPGRLVQPTQEVELDDDRRHVIRLALIAGERSGVFVESGQNLGGGSITTRPQ